MTFSGQSLATIREMELSYHHYISIRYMCELLHKLPKKLKLTIFENQAISRKPLRSLGFNASTPLATRNKSFDSCARKMKRISSKKFRRKTYFT